MITQSASLPWNSGRPVPVDFGGPVSVPFTPFDAALPGITAFEAMADRHPGKIAIDDGRLCLTYRQVRQAAYALMKQLAELPQNRPVLALLHNTAAFPIVFLAHLGTGRPLVPVDASDPPERQHAIMRETMPAAILLDTGTTVPETLFPPAIPRIPLRLDTENTLSRPAVSPRLQDAAGVAFTSGSTGRPKGLAFSQRQFLNGSAEYVDACHINANDRILCLASLSGAGCRDALVALFTGATLRIVNIKTAGIGAVLRALETGGITILSFVPSVLRALARLDGATAAFRSLRILDLFGERTSAADLALLRAVLPEDCHIRLSLASTEAAIMFHWFVQPDAIIEGQPVPCGYIARGVAMALLHEDGTAADAHTGELVVRGEALALGSWQQGRLLPGGFLPDPENPNARIYHTGDVIRLRPDGLAEFLGRRDRQVKIRGLRADLAELEDALRQHPAIAEVAVVPQLVDDDTRLIAYIVPTAPNDAPEPEALRDWLRSTMPAHMVPARVRFLPALPRLPSFKPDLQALARL